MKSKSLKVCINNSIKDAIKFKDINKENFLNRILVVLEPSLKMIEDVNKENSILFDYIKKESIRKQERVMTYTKKHRKDLVEIESYELAILNMVMSCFEEKSLF
ncbi:MAG: GatB/YqeY domain-containing protein [Richelia sp. RM2_1_2]|nr:GatB/YqeY domain-containing protein [Richelia sp. RM2_1_2]